MLTQETPPDIVAEKAASLAERDRHFRWNFATMGIDIAFFTLGMNISSAYVVLPLFVHHLSSSNTAAALITAVRALGVWGTQLILAGYVEGLRRTKPILLIVTILERLPYLILAGEQCCWWGRIPSGCGTLLSAHSLADAGQRTLDDALARSGGARHSR